MQRMSFEGRGSAVGVVMVVYCLLLVLQYCEVAQAATFTVGGARGWAFNVVGWPKGKRFSAGDTLVFNYNSSFHNVVAVNKGGYDTCIAPSGAQTYQTGKDQIQLVRGPNFFICNVSNHCQSGMKIAVTAA